ncbi:hypothetical protein TorRG33x02_092640, partial [Trema orientale]
PRTVGLAEFVKEGVGLPFLFSRAAAPRPRKQLVASTLAAGGQGRAATAWNSGLGWWSWRLCING